ncbi:response regulator transcription factor [Pedobacter changchengzhani]|uniref:Response regulator transcription factor n=1 Tax=Pedobacter changchengzhani TaxID=2529274 RepID=A0A4R5MPV3_9SPHI|nr:response regulator transcription factor [Pedobacter changchengzhani]TDG37824.1 response regulator transcription factor [Pedobacter changchengzhani]
MTKTSLYIADDHQILIDGLTAFFHTTDDLEVIGHANDGMTLLRELNHKKPQIILLDLNMPKFDGLKTLQRLVIDYPQIKVIILSNYDQAHLIKETEKMGAKGYLLKNGSKKELLEAIEAVKNGGTYFNIKEPIEDTESDVFVDVFKKRFQLTKREIEIIRLVCNGASTPELSKKLFIAENTVNTHRRNIMYKLDVKNVAGLIGFARENGLL